MSNKEIQEKEIEKNLTKLIQEITNNIKENLKGYVGEKSKKVKNDIELYLTQVSDFIQSNELYNQEESIKRELIKLYEALKTLKLREIPKEEYIIDILEGKVNRNSSFVKETGSEKYLRVLSKQGLGSNIKINEALNKIKRNNIIKVSPSKISEVYENLLTLISQYTLNKNIRQLRDGVRQVIETNKPKEDENGTDLFGKTNLSTKGKDFSEPLINKILSSNEEFDWNNYGDEEKEMLNSVFTSLIGYDDQLLFTVENQMNDIANKEYLNEELIKTGEEYGKQIANKIIDSEFENFKVDIDLDTKLSNNFDYTSIVEEIKSHLEDKNLQTSEMAEVVSVYVNYFQNDFDPQDSDIVNKKGNINFNNINKYIANNTFTYCKGYKSKKGKISRTSKKDYDEVSEFFPLFECKEDGSLKRLGKPTGGSIDSVYYSRKKQKAIGTSTTVDTTGTIEGDQFARHAFKNKKINEFLNKVIDNQKEEKDQNIYNQIQEYTKLNEDNKEEYEKLLKIQSLKSDNTFQVIISEYQGKPYKEGDKITTDTLIWLFEENDFNFDMFGTVVTKESKGIEKYLEVLSFLEAQKSEDYKKYYDKDTLDSLYLFLNKRVKGYSIYTEITSGNNKENTHNLNKKLIEISPYIVDSLIDNSKDNNDFDLGKEIIEELKKDPNITRQLKDIEEIYTNMINSIEKEELRETLKKNINIEILLEEQIMFFKRTLNTSGDKHRRTINLTSQNFMEEILTSNPYNLTFLVDLMDKMVEEEKIKLETLREDGFKGKIRAQRAEEEKQRMEEEKQVIQMIESYIKQEEYSLEEYVDSEVFTMEQYEKYRIKAEEGIFWTKLGLKGIKLKKECDIKGLSLSEFIINKYFSTPEDEEKIREQINGMRNIKLERLADATEEELENAIQEILKEQKIDITKEDSKKLNEEIKKVATNKFKGM